MRDLPRHYLICRISSGHSRIEPDLPNLSKGLSPCVRQRTFANATHACVDSPSTLSFLLRLLQSFAAREVKLASPTGESSNHTDSNCQLKSMDEVTIDRLFETFREWESSLASSRKGEARRDQFSTPPMSMTNITDLIRSLARLLSDASIAALLNRLGKRTIKGNTWNAVRLRAFRDDHDIAVYRDGERSISGPATTVRRGIRAS